MIIGIDPGSRRVGVAAADDETKIARPVEVIDVKEIDPAERVAALVDELGARLVVVGRPTGLSGVAGPAVAAQQELVELLRSRLAVEVVEYDERLTTVLADRAMAASGARRNARKTMRDAVAAQVMLQGYVDSEAGR